MMDLPFLESEKRGSREKMAAFPLHPTDPFTILVPQDQEIGQFYVGQERYATDFEAPKLRKGRSGNSVLPLLPRQP